MNFLGVLQKYSWTDRLLILLGLVGSLIFSWILIFVSTGSIDLSGVSEIGTLTTTKSVKQRHARALAWDSLVKQGNIYTRDLIYTPSGTSAEVTLKGQNVLYLAPETLVEFDPVSLNEFDIVLLRGKGKIRNLANNTEKEIRAEKKASSLIKAASAVALPFQYVEPKTWAKQQREKVKQALKKIQVSDVKPVKSLAEVIPFELSDFILELQPINPMNTDAGQIPWYQMAWSQIPIPGVVYELEVSRNPNFQRTIQQTFKTSRAKVQFLENGIHYWRVVAKEKEKKQTTQPQAINVNGNPNAD